MKQGDNEGFLSQILLSSLRMKQVYSFYKPEESTSSSLVRCPSPTHRDSTSSCKIYSSLDTTGNPDTIYCFGCGLSGNVITLTAKLEGVSNLQAMQILKERYNVKEDLKQLALRDRYSLQRIKVEFERTFDFYMSNLRKFGIIPSMQELAELEDIYLQSDIRALKEFYRKLYARYKNDKL